MTYLPKTERMMEEVKRKGFNIWAMVNLYRKRSRLQPQIPDEVLQGVCMEYLKRSDTIREQFAYFLVVLSMQTQKHFAEKNIREHAAIKKDPVRLKITIG